MTDLPYSSTLTRGAPRTRPTSRIVILYALALLAGGLGAASALAQAGDTTGIEWQLSLLMHFMAGLKALMVVAALGLAHWRFRRPVEAPLAASYVIGVALMAVAPGLIWSMAHIGLGALCFHAGLLTVLITAWRDAAAALPLAARR